MKRTIALLTLGAALVMSASAQTYSQPVREVNHETRNPVSGYCVIQWVNTVGVSSCDLYVVPAGKRLAVRDVSLRCGVSNSASVMAAYFAGAGAHQTLVLLQQIADNNGSGRLYAGARTAFLHVNSGPLRATAWLNGDALQNPGCEVSFNGFLVDAQ
jgi:hypothetical protein